MSSSPGALPWHGPDDDHDHEVESEPPEVGSEPNTSPAHDQGAVVVGRRRS